MPTTKNSKIPRHVDRLYRAVGNYVKKTGGSILVIGGVQVQEDVGSVNYRIAIKCTGKPPKFVEREAKG